MLFLEGMPQRIGHLSARPHRISIAVCLAVCLCCTLSSLLATTLIVPADSNIFSGEQPLPPDPGGAGGGELPPEFDFGFAAGAGLVLTFSSVTGDVMLDSGTGNHLNDPDGIGSASGINVNSFDGISGIMANNAGFLAGVFLGLSAPHNPVPLRLDFTTINTSFTSLSPQLDQVFFIGDGLTGDGTGTVQQFNVPVGATRLVLGLVDAPGYSGDPGGYSDNLGSFTATFILTVPEPSTFALFFIGWGLVIPLRRIIPTGRHQNL